MSSLWGDDFIVDSEKEKTKTILKKSQQSQIDKKTDSQKLRSRIVPIHEKLDIIKTSVYKILGTYASQTVVIRTKEDFIDYIDTAIENNVIAIDTETNNSLDPFTCKLMGLCLYTPNKKNAYIPVNHVDPDTGELLDNQLTEEDIKEQLIRLRNTFVIMHNSSFDCKVLGFTTGEFVHVDWDTITGAYILDENEPAGLKEQYISKIDPSIEKYSIEKLFTNIEYAKVDPSIFALYAATDSYMTYKLYLYQKEQLERPENAKLYKLFIDVEMPIARVLNEVEINGVCIDTDYAERLAKDYHNKLSEIDKEIDAELKNLSQKILDWRLTPEANYKQKKKTVTKSGEEYDKSKNEKLSDPINVSSPEQLAILIYDVMKFPVIDKKSPRGTGEEILEAIKKDFKLAEIILRRRGIEKLLNTFIEAIPKQISPYDGRLHTKFKANGAKTGRLSSRDPNLQNIPSGEKCIRLMFKASQGYSIIGGDFSLRKAG